MPVASVRRQSAAVAMWKMRSGAASRSPCEGNDMAERVYVVTDIEVDGFVPGPHSMLALGSVAVTAAGEQVWEFEAVLERLPGAQPDPATWEW